MLHKLDAPIRALVRLAAAIAGGTEAAIRQEVEACATAADPVAVEEVILQSYLFAGFPRTLNAVRAWRSASGREAPADGAATADNVALWRERGERVCGVVYGTAYERLRRNVRALHPALDEWMIVEGYGKVLGRPELDLKTRELAIVAACAASRQQRQLHSHLHGALNAGARPEEVDAVLRSLNDLIPEPALEGYRQLLRKVISAREQASSG